MKTVILWVSLYFTLYMLLGAGTLQKNNNGILNYQIWQFIDLKHSLSAGLNYNYSWLSLFRPRLSRITAYLEVKIWSLPKHENLTTGKKNIVEKRRNCS